MQCACKATSLSLVNRAIEVPWDAAQEGGLEGAAAAACCAAPGAAVAVRVSCARGAEWEPQLCGLNSGSQRSGGQERMQCPWNTHRGNTVRSALLARSDLRKFWMNARTFERG